MSGLDLPDDGRGAAVVDWDLDGDLDLCVSNRNGPQLRLLRNDFPEPGGYLVIVLEGTSSNRDAIGARLELFLEGQSVPLVRTLHAGDSFLSQSSKKIHFGLGDAVAIDRLVVHWPGDLAETIQNLDIGQWYSITQGTGRAKLWRVPANGEGVNSAPLAASDSSQQARVFTHAPIPLPKFQYSSFKGDKLSPMINGRPVLVNLWASWCAPCLTELQAFSSEAAAVRKFGLDVLALSVEADSRKAERFLESCRWPFRSGVVSPEVISQLQSVNNFVLDVHEALPVPTSFLIDHDGNLQGIFKGPIEVEWLLENVAQLVRLPTSGEGRSRAALPFTGRWFTDPRRLNYIDLAIELAETAPVDTALGYFSSNRQVFLQSPRAPRLLFGLGQRLEEEQRFAEAEAYFREALARAPNYVDALNGLARLREKH